VLVYDFVMYTSQTNSIITAVNLSAD